MHLEPISGSRIRLTEKVQVNVGLEENVMKRVLLTIAVLLLPLIALAEPIAYLDLPRSVAVATNAIVHQLPHINLADLRFDNATLRSDTNSTTMTVCFFLPIPDPDWERRGMENGKLIFVSMDLNGNNAVAGESKATIACRKASLHEPNTNLEPISGS
jgi:hypothetical protein